LSYHNVAREKFQNEAIDKELARKTGNAQGVRSRLIAGPSTQWASSDEDGEVTGEGAKKRKGN
jgi:hypothetical protein